VGSNNIAGREDVSVSSATVRNEMHDLETEGYLVQPHTSAGRIPTEKGYRFFVDDMSGSESLSPAGVAQVSEFFAAAHGELEEMLRRTSHLLSTLTGTAAVVTEEQADASTVRSVQLIDLSPSVLMVVVVTSTGAVFKRTFDTADGEPVAEADLADAQRLLAEALLGRPLSEVPDATFPAGAPGSALAALGAAAITAGAEGDAAQVYVDGTSRIAHVFDARETVESVLTVLEKQFVVVSLLKEMVDGGLTVAIGSETGVEPLAECSLVVAPYATEAGPAGAIAVLGPTRMNYTQTVSAVAQVSQRLSRLLTEG